VAHVIDSGGLYGAERVVLTLMQQQVRQGIGTRLISIGNLSSPEKALEREARRLGLPLHVIRMRDGLNVAGALRILRECRAHGVELLHLHGYKANILIGGMPRRLRRLPAVATLHGWTAVGTGKMRLYEWLDARAQSRLDRVVVVTSSMLDHPRLHGRVRADLEVIPNAIDEPAGGPAPHPGLAGRFAAGFRLGSFGRLSKEKGHELLLRAVRRLVDAGIDARLLLLGEGPERGPLEAQVQALNLADRLAMPGYIEGAQGHMKLLDVFVLPSHTEGLPLVALEAMRAGIPIVASAVGGLPELLQGGRCGVLVPPGDVDALADALLELAREPAKRAEFAQRAQAATAERTAEAMAARYLEVYRRALATEDGRS
jgi:glycosyltransferase involved in cell wall biosynthesis